MLEEFKTHIHNETLRYAVSRAITCPNCGDILDCQDAALVEPEKGKMFIRCAECFDNLLDGFAPGSIIPPAKVTLWNRGEAEMISLLPDCQAHNPDQLTLSL